MTGNEGRRHSSFVRVRDNFAQRAADFSETGVARQTATELSAIITQLEGHAAAQAAGIGQARQHTQTRGQARRALRDDLESIRRIALAMGLGNQFELPGDTDEALLNGSRAFATNALPLKQQVIAHEMPEDFLEELNADINAMAAAIADQTNAVGDHIAAGAAIDDLIDRGMELVRKLDAIMKTKYADNAAVLAEWTAAKHVERAPRHSAPVSPPSPGPPAPPA